MIYLAIMVLVAAAGITRLYLQQRRERLSVEKADSFWAGLERIAVHPDPRVTAAPTKRRERKPRPRVFGPEKSAGLDPARREAAKRRIERRRRIAAQREAARRAAGARRQAAVRAQAARRASARQAARPAAAPGRPMPRNGAPRQQQRNGAPRQQQPRNGEAGQNPAPRGVPQPGKLVKRPAATPQSVRRRAPMPQAKKRSVDPLPRPVPVPDSSELPRIMVRNVEPRRIDLGDRHPDWIDLRQTTGRYIR